MFRKSVWIPILIVLLAVMGCGLFYNSRISNQLPLKFYKRVEFKTSATPKPPPSGETTESGHWHGNQWHAEPHDPPAQPQQVEPGPPPLIESAEVQGTPVDAQPIDAPIIEQAVRNGNVTLFYARTQEYHDAVKVWKDWHKKFDEIHVLDMQAGQMLIDALPTEEEAKRYENDEQFKRELGRKVTEAGKRIGEVTRMRREHKAKKPPVPYIR